MVIMPMEGHNPKRPSGPKLRNYSPSKHGGSSIPVSVARQKRREAHQHKGIDIHRYKPGYTWNRGGRVKELRIRFVCSAVETKNI